MVWARVRGPLAALTACVVLAASTIAVTRTGLFHVRRFEIHGSARLSETQVARLSGITTRDNAIWLDEAAAEERLHRDPWIGRADVEVDLPWTVTITLTERSPIASTWHGDERALVAADGTILGAGRAAGLPVIDAPPSWVDPAGTDQVSDAALALSALEPDLRERVRRVLVGGPRGLELLLTDGLRVTFGSADAYAAKARVMGEVLTWLERTGGRFRAVDVSAPSAPTVTGRP